MEAFLLALNSTLLADSGKTVVIGFLVVLVVLLLLTFIFWLFGAIAGTKKNGAPVGNEVPPELVAAIAGVVSAETDEASDEVAAVIAAAVAAMSDGSSRYVVRRITPAGKGVRPVWAAAGIAQNTQPF